jgi:hypothetical protein
MLHIFWSDDLKRDRVIVKTLTARQIVVWGVKILTRLENSKTRKEGGGGGYYYFYYYLLIPLTIVRHLDDRLTVC